MGHEQAGEASLKGEATARGFPWPRNAETPVSFALRPRLARPRVQAWLKKRRNRRLVAAAPTASPRRPHLGDLVLERRRERQQPAQRCARRVGARASSRGRAAAAVAVRAATLVPIFVVSR